MIFDHFSLLFLIGKFLDMHSHQPSLKTDTDSETVDIASTKGSIGKSAEFSSRHYHVNSDTYFGESTTKLQIKPLGKGLLPQIDIQFSQEELKLHLTNP